MNTMSLTGEWFRSSEPESIPYDPNMTVPASWFPTAGTPGIFQFARAVETVEDDIHEALRRR